MKRHEALLHELAAMEQQVVTPTKMITLSFIYSFSILMC